MSDAIQAEQLGKTFKGDGKEVVAVRDISLGVRSGELFGLFGHNGAGKSTLVRMLSTLVRPSSGRARVGGWDLARDEQRVRASIGLVASDERSFYGRLSAFDNLRFYAALQNVPRRLVRARAEYTLDLFSLSDLGGRAVQTFSTGQRQRLNMARALLHDPPILFLDEPTKSMDVQTADFVKALVKNELVRRQGKTVVFISHELYEMEDYCDRMAVVRRGELRALGSPAELMRQLPVEPVYQIELEGRIEAVVSALRQIPAIESVSLVRREGSPSTPFDTLRQAQGARLRVPGSGRSAVLELRLRHQDGEPAGPLHGELVELKAEAGWEWQAQLWQAIASNGGYVREYRQLASRSLRDVIRYFSADEPDAVPRQAQDEALSSSGTITNGEHDADYSVHG
ncbi:MAG: ABC transporter ATP-binding protein [Chloroflexi bacterium]|nr:ABC transporter ATP-binding protein [Chloroflexota bacterium]